MTIRQGIDFKADILSSLPKADTTPPVIEAEPKFFQQASRKVILSFAGEDKHKAYDEFLAFALQQGWQVQKPDNNTITQFAQFYAQYQGHLLTSEYKDKIKSGDRFSHYFSEQLSQISNPIISVTIERDPSLATASYLESLLSQPTSLMMINERLVAYNQPQKPLVLIIDVTSKDFQSANNALTVDEAIRIANELKNQRIVLNKQLDAEITISGILLHNAENAENAKWEMRVFGTISMIATIMLVVLAFRSVTPILWIFITIANAVIAGFCALSLAFDSIHIITLVFGLSLIGLCVDYCLHVLSAQYLQSSKSLVKTLIFAFITTAFCYLLFLFTPLLILKQVAIFVCAGLLSALLTSYCLSGHYLSTTARPSNETNGFVFLLRNKLLEHQKSTIITTICLMIFSATQPLSFDDNIANLNASSVELINAEKHHRKLIGQDGVERVFLYHNSLQTLLEQEEILAERVAQSFPEARINKLSNWLPSIKKQQLNLAEYHYANASNTFASIAEFVDVNQPLFQRNNLEYEDLASGLGEDIVAHLYQQAASAHVSVVEIIGVSKSDMESIISVSGNMILYDKQASLSQVLASFRVELGYWLAWATFVILIIFFIRFDWQSTIKAAFALISSIYCALVISQLVQGALNIFNLLSAILVIGLAVDYLIFYRARELSDANILAIGLSVASSLFVFGMLAFSQTPAIKSFGITVTFGLVFIYLLAPLVVKEDHERRSI